MTFIEFIGFIISLAAMAFLMAKRGMDERKRRRNPEAYEAELEKQEGKLRDFLKSLDMDMEEVDRIVPPPPPPSVRYALPPPLPKKEAVLKPHSKMSKKLLGREYQFQTSLESYAPKTAIEQRKIKTSFEDYQSPKGLQKHNLSDRAELSYNITRSNTQSRGAQVLSKLDSKKDWVVIQEILGPPTALRKSVNGYW